MQERIEKHAGICDLLVPRLPPFFSMPTRPDTIHFGTRNEVRSLMIGTFSGTPVGSRKLSTYDFTLIPNIKTDGGIETLTPTVKKHNRRPY